MRHKNRIFFRARQQSIHGGSAKDLTWVIPLAVCNCFYLFSMNSTIAQTTTAPQDATEKALLERTLDRSLPTTVRLEKFHELFSLPKTAKADALRSLALGQDEEFAIMSSEALVREHETNVGPELLPAFRQWSTAAQSALLETIFQTPRSIAGDPSLLEFARAVLAGDPKQWTNPGTGQPDPIVMASLILADFGTVSDKSLVEIALRQRSKNALVWLAAMECQLEGAEQLELAKATYMNASQDSLTRIAAALTAGAAGDEAGTTYALTQIDDLMKTFAAHDAKQMLIDAYKNPDAKMQLSKLNRMVVAINWLRFINSPQAKSLANRGLDANNFFVRSAAGLAASRRWPELLLAKKPEHSDADEYRDYMCVIMLMHPELSQDAQSRVSPTEITKGLKRFDQMSLAGIFGPGGVATVAASAKTLNRHEK